MLKNKVPMPHTYTETVQSNYCLPTPADFKPTLLLTETTKHYTTLHYTHTCPTEVKPKHQHVSDRSQTKTSTRVRLNSDQPLTRVRLKSNQT